MPNEIQNVSGNVAQKPQPVAQLKAALQNINVKARFQEVLGEKAAPFMASIVNVVTGNDKLKACEPNSIIGAAFVAATMDLPIDPAFGFAALVPYNVTKKDLHGQRYTVNVCQLQVGYKGFVQLAVRSGLYEEMNASEVYEDELVEYNPIRGTCKFSDVHIMRGNGQTDKIVGYYAWFKLRTGFVKEIYMTKEQIKQHAQKYSQSYRTDLNKGWNTSRWSTDFDAMARKTVLKSLLSKWGPLSVDIQNAIVNDQKVYDDIDNGDYTDNSAAIETHEGETPNPFTIEQAAEEQAGPDEMDVIPVTGSVQVLDTDLPFA